MGGRLGKGKIRFSNRECEGVGVAEYNRLRASASKICFFLTLRMPCVTVTVTGSCAVVDVG